MKTQVNSNWNLALTFAAFLMGCLLTFDVSAKSLYKSVNADGKITYSNHPAVASKTAQNISLLKDSPKFSIATKQSARSSKS